MLTVRDLVGAMELELAAGERSATAPIRWVHVSELPDPTPWLSGGELLLSTGMALDGEKAQRAYVRRLVEHQLAGLGFGVGFAHAELPAALVDEARLLEFPLFAVPYEMPFIALTERAFTSLVNEQLDLLQRAVSIQRRMERLVLDERSLGEVVRGLANSIGATVMVLDAAGRPLASHAFRRELDDGAESLRSALRWPRARASRSRAASCPQSSELGGRAIALPVPSGSRGAADVVARCAPRERQRRRLRALPRPSRSDGRGARADARARRRGDRAPPRRRCDRAVLSGRLDPDEVVARLAPSRFAATRPCCCSPSEDPDALEDELERILGELGVARARRDRRRPRAAACCARCSPGPRAPSTSPPPHASCCPGACAPRSAARRRSPPCGEASTRRAAHSRSARSPTASAPAVASPDDLGAYRLLLSLQDDDGLRQYCDDVLRTDERRPRRQRRGAAALARGVPRAQRQLGGRSAGTVLPPAHPALPDVAGRGAHGAPA